MEISDDAKKGAVGGSGISENVDEDAVKRAAKNAGENAVESLRISELADENADSLKFFEDAKTDASDLEFSERVDEENFRNFNAAVRAFGISRNDLILDEINFS